MFLFFQAFPYFQQVLLMVVEPLNATVLQLLLPVHNPVFLLVGVGHVTSTVCRDWLMFLHIIPQVFSVLQSHNMQRK